MVMANSLFTRVGIFPGDNIQVTHTKPNEPRSECSIVVDPTNPQRLLGASKHFTDPQKYVFSLGVVFSEDGGITWTDHAAFAPPANHDIYTDPSVAFDTKGNWWVNGDPGFFYGQHQTFATSIGCTSGTPLEIDTTHMLTNKSSDHGATWTPHPIIAPRCKGDDKGWIVCDNSTARVGIGKFSKPKSPFHGRLYVIWGAVTPFRFARSLDNGATWTGTSGQPAGADVYGGCYAPDISIGSNGWVHVFWHNPGDSSIQYVRSKNGGDSFEGPTGVAAPFNVVTGLTDLTVGLGTDSDGWTVFPGAVFRTLTIVSACCFGDSGVMVCWTDARQLAGQKRARTFYRVSYDNGDTWQGDPSGTPLLPQLSDDSYQFQPQIAATGSGVIGCAMYSYSQTSRAGGKPGVDVLMACSFDHGATFDFTVVTDHAWDPSLHAPLADGVGSTTFIGDYFGLDASAKDFHVLWTDTRTGTQDLFYCDVATEKVERPGWGEIYGTLVGGVAVDGGGYIIVNGHLIRIPPWDPMVQILIALAAIQSVSRMNLGETVAGREVLYDLVIQVAQLAKAQLKGGAATGEVGE